MSIPKLIIVTTKFFLIAPFSIKKNYCKYFNKYACHLAIGVIALGCLHQMIGRLIYRFPELQSTSIITETLTLFAISLANATITASLLIQKRSFRKFTKQLHRLELILNKYLPGYNIENKITFMYVMFTLPGCYDSQMQYTAIPLEQYQFVLLESILRVRLGIIILYIYSVIKEIFITSKAINSVLKILCDDPLHPGVGIKTFSGAKNVLETVKDVTKCYELLEGAVHEFNRLFGFSIFCVFIYLISCFLIAFNLPLTWDKAFNVTRYKIWGFIYMSFGVAGVSLLTGICRKITKEVETTAFLAYCLLQRCELKTMRELNKRVFLLLKYSTWRYPAFSAGGFFLLDNTTVQLLMMLLVSYVVVLYQFYHVLK